MKFKGSWDTHLALRESGLTTVQSLYCQIFIKSKAVILIEK